MDYRQVLEKLELFRRIAEKVYHDSAQCTAQDFEELATRYGEIEEIVARFTSVTPITVPSDWGAQPATYSNYIEAGFLSGHGAHKHRGYMQLMKVIGKVRQLGEDPSVLLPSPSVTHLLQILHRFRECCQYHQPPPQDERAVQDILWIMLRSQFERTSSPNPVWCDSVS